MADRPHNFSMQTRHGAPDDFRHPRDVHISGIGVSPPETDEAAFSFARFRGGKRLIDRKSTRLNSSHVSISYAVFCLKKKKKKTSVNSTKNNKSKTTERCIIQ